MPARQHESDPHGPTPLPGFPPGTTNHQVMVFLLAVPQVGPLWPTHDFIRCAGSVAEDHVTRNFIRPFGHADHWFSADHRQILEGDILRWLERHED